MFDRSKPKIGCSSLITIRWTCSGSFDVRKNDVPVCLMSNLVNISIALLDSMYDVRCSKPKIGCLSSIINRWTCSGSFDVRKMMMEFVRCLMKWCLTYHYKKENDSNFPGIFWCFLWGFFFWKVSKLRWRQQWLQFSKERNLSGRVGWLVAKP